MRYFETLTRHHRWAVERLLAAAELVTDGELRAESLSHGSILGTLQHMADVDQSWGRVARGVPQLEASDVATFDSLGELRAFWMPEIDEIIAFSATLTPDALDAPVLPPWKTRTFATWQILMHISNHAAEHGSEVGWQLSRLGHPPGELAFMLYVDTHRQ